MSSPLAPYKERLARDLENNLIFFANRQNKSLSREEAVEISQRVMKNLDTENKVFKHKGTSWIAREIMTSRK